MLNRHWRYECFVRMITASTSVLSLSDPAQLSQSNRFLVKYIQIVFQNCKALRTGFLEMSDDPRHRMKISKTAPADGITCIKSAMQYKLVHTLAVLRPSFLGVRHMTTFITNVL